MDFRKYLKSPEEREADAQARAEQPLIKRIGRFVVPATLIGGASLAMGEIAEESPGGAQVILGSMFAVAIGGAVFNHFRRDNESQPDSGSSQE